MCAYGDCHESDKLPVKVSIGYGEHRVRFCSEYHAALWLVRLARIRKQTDEGDANFIVSLLKRGYTVSR